MGQTMLSRERQQQGCPGVDGAEPLREGNGPTLSSLWQSISHPGKVKGGRREQLLIALLNKTLQFHLFAVSLIGAAGGKHLSFVLCSSLMGSELNLRHAWILAGKNNKASYFFSIGIKITFFSSPTTHEESL